VQAIRTCSIDGCDRALCARGWCQTHYMRWRRHGDVETNLAPKDLTVVERFYTHVAKTAGGCWLWTGSLNHAGYGTFGVEGQTWRVHRLAWVLAGNELIDGMEIDHVKARGCAHRSCVNPAHLEQVTQLENIHRRDLARKGLT
jgi:hypothetical protein